MGNQLLVNLSEEPLDTNTTVAVNCSPTIKLFVPIIYITMNHLLIKTAQMATPAQ